MEIKKQNHDLQRIQRALRKGAIQRNVKTGMIVAAAASGALISTPALVLTAGVTMGALYFANNKNKPKGFQEGDNENNFLDSGEEDRRK